MTGRISLYDKDGVLVARRHYRDRDYRKTVLHRWRMSFGKSYGGGFIHIIPDANIGRVRKDGTNMATIANKKTDTVVDSWLPNRSFKETLHQV